LGTANNLARTLGFDQPVKKLIAQLGRGEKTRFDVGLARGPWGRRLVFEGAGAGLFAEYLHEQKRKEKKKEAVSKAEQLRRHFRGLTQRLRRQPARKWQIELDGEDFSGRYLLWQAMNIRSIGPVLAFAAGARTNDGLFDFVGVPEEERESLLQHFKARLTGRKKKSPLTVRRFKKMRLRSLEAPIHLDDEPWPKEDEKLTKNRRVKITVKRGALRILKPKR
jgi:diacylglycerol kinase (ATP)